MVFLMLSVILLFALRTLNFPCFFIVVLNMISRIEKK